MQNPSAYDLERHFKGEKQMGRPLNKKWFGNLNTPAIGGEGVASIAVSGTNTGYTAVPALSISAPDLATGVQAVARAHMEVAGVTNFQNGDGYAPAQILTLSETGAVGTAGTLRVLTTEVSTVAIGAAGAGGWTPGDTVVTVATGTGTAATVTVTADALGAVTGVAIKTRGSYTVNPTLDNVAVTGGPGGNGGGLLLDLTMRIGTVEVATGGDYTALPADVTRFNVTTGTADFNLTFKVKSAEVTTAGSGYTSTPTVTDSGNADFTATLAAVKGNAITAYAQTTSGGSNKIADIEKQVSSRRYKVTTADGTAVCTLVTDGVANAAGEMTITAIDAKGNTYYVKKLTARRATLVRLTDVGNQGDWVYATDESAPWSFAAASGVYVQIANN